MIIQQNFIHTKSRYNRIQPFLIFHPIFFLLILFYFLRELAELHKKIAAKETSLTEATSSKESQLKEEIELAVEKERITSQKSQEALRWELDNLRQDFSRVEQQHLVREEMLRKEIADLQQVRII